MNPSLDNLQDPALADARMHQVDGGVLAGDHLSSTFLNVPRERGKE
jgi:hypothetical protein